LNAKTDTILYNNPVKDEEDLEFAYQSGIQVTTADSLEELLKIRYFAPKMKILWRITTPINDEKFHLSEK
jgi:diaminopimelate decarboxylase